MKDTPILFTPENAQKVHEHRKSQTRRIVKPQPEEGMTILGPELYAPCKEDKDGDIYPGEEVFGVYSDDGEWGVACPYGTVGDKLWCHEHHYLFGHWEKNLTEIPGKHEWRFICERSHGVRFPVNRPDVIERDKAKLGWFSRPSIDMPKWATRTWLELTDVRVERLNSISYEDCLAEGIEVSDLLTRYEPREKYAPLVIASYRKLWESINGKDSWGANPWVWVLEYKKVQP